MAFFSSFLVLKLGCSRHRLSESLTKNTWKMSFRIRMCLFGLKNSKFKINTPKIPQNSKTWPLKTWDLENLPSKTGFSIVRSRGRPLKSWDIKILDFNRFINLKTPKITSIFYRWYTTESHFLLSHSDLYQSVFSLVIFRSLKNTYYFSTALIVNIYLFLLFYCPFTALLCFFLIQPKGCDIQ